MLPPTPALGESVGVESAGKSSHSPHPTLQKPKKSESSNSFHYCLPKKARVRRLWGDQRPEGALADDSRGEEERDLLENPPEDVGRLRGPDLVPEVVGGGVRWWNPQVWKSRNRRAYRPPNRSAE